MDQVQGQGTKRGQRRGKLPCRGTGGLPPGWWWSGECTTAVPSCSSDRSPLESGEWEDVEGEVWGVGCGGRGVGGCGGRGVEGEVWREGCGVWGVEGGEWEDVEGEVWREGSGVWGVGCGGRGVGGCGGSGVEGVVWREGSGE